jgi:hypothetical protein
MVKTFKQFMTEIYVMDAISVTSQHRKLNNDSIKKNYDLHHTSKMGDYDISHATHKKDKTQTATFIHHNGEHIGTIYGHSHQDGKKGFIVGKTSLFKKHQGKNLMTKTYAHLVTKHNHEIHSDRVQSYGGHNIWKNLHKIPGVKVSAVQKNKKTIEPSFHDIGKNHIKRNSDVEKINHYVAKKSE